MGAAASRMESEAREAAAVAERQARELGDLLGPLAERLRRLDPRLILTCARGSSDHAATYAKYMVETVLKVPAASHAPSVSSVYGVKWRGLDRTVFLAISQSGRSPDLILSAEAARTAGAYALAMVNAPGSPLAAASDAELPLLAGPETSVAATKSYVGSLLAIAHLVAEWAEDDALRSALAAAPATLRAAADLDWSAGVEALSDISNMYVLGRGSTFAIAQEAALKLKETCGIHAEAVSAAEVRHGPMAIAGAGFPVLVFVPADAARDSVLAIAAELAARGAKLLMVGGQVQGGLTLRAAEAPAQIAPMGFITSFYIMAAALSRARGLDPDAPPHLKKVTETR